MCVHGFVIQCVSMTVSNNKSNACMPMFCFVFLFQAGAMDMALVAAQAGIDAFPNSEALLTLKVIVFGGGEREKYMRPVLG